MTRLETSVSNRTGAFVIGVDREQKVAFRIVRYAQTNHRPPTVLSRALPLTRAHFLPTHRESAGFNGGAAAAAAASASSSSSSSLIGLAQNTSSTRSLRLPLSPPTYCRSFYLHLARARAPSTEHGDRCSSQLSLSLLRRLRRNTRQKDGDCERAIRRRRASRKKRNVSNARSLSASRHLRVVHARDRRTEQRAYETHDMAFAVRLDVVGRRSPRTEGSPLRQRSAAFVRLRAPRLLYRPAGRASRTIGRPNVHFHSH